MAGVEDGESDGAEDDGESQAKSHEKREPEGDAAERDGGQEQDQRGWTRDQAAAGAERDQAADAHFLRHVSVNAAVAMVVRETRGMNVDAAYGAAVKEHGADPNNGDSGDGAEDRSDGLGEHKAREVERYQAEREDADGVGESHHQAEEDGVAGGAARADEVGRYQGFAVAGRERVHGAEREGGQHAEQHYAPADLALVQECGKIIALSWHYNGSLHYMRQVITAQDVPAGGELRVPVGTIVTSSAREVAAGRGVRIVEVAEDQLTALAPPDRTVAIGSDHGGFRLKEALKPLLEGLGLQVRDVGVNEENPADYPDIAHAVAKLVAGGTATRGVIIDGAGIGSCMAANKVPGIRAALCYDKASAKNGREHNDSNGLTLGARLLTQTQAEEVLRTWLETPFAGGRHQARVQKIMDVEQQYSKKASS